MTVRSVAFAKRPGVDRYPSRWHALRSHPSWPWLKRAAALIFFAAVATLIVIEARKVQWGEVVAAVQRMPWTPLLIAVGLAIASHLTYSCYDLLGRSYTGHRLRTQTVLAVTFISYAFNLNMGFLLGGAGMRFRLYTQLKLGLDVVTRIMTLSMLTNWSGYMLLFGVVLLWKPVALPFEWLARPGLHDLIAWVLILTPLAYVAACAFMRRRVVQIRGHRLMLPSFRLAAMQVVLSSANWMIMAALVYTLLLQRVDYPSVLCALLVAAIAGVISHVPAGIGVLEAVFVLLLSHVPKETLLAVLLTYRAIYYLMPLVVAATMYFMFEARIKVRRGRELSDAATSGAADTQH
jgi:uncharacterized membrane protein YbhN (UPF0104 family)